MSERTRPLRLEESKQSYRAPTLRVFGDMRELTLGTKGGVKGDGPDDPMGPATRVVT